jgi:hypothetical protein
MRKISLVLLALVLAMSMLIPLSLTTMASSVTPIHLIGYTGNPPPPTPPAGVTYSAFKIEQPITDDVFSDGYGLIITISNVKIDGDGNRYQFDWSSNIPVAIVYVKDGDDGTNEYIYPANTMSDSELMTPLGTHGAAHKNISHLVFYYIVNPTASVPELPAAALFGIGLAGIGAFIIIRKRRSSVSTR